MKLSLCLVICLLMSCVLDAQEASENKVQSPSEATAKEASSEQDEDGYPSIEEKTNGMKQLEGFFNLYWDENREKLWMEVSDWDREFLYVTSTPGNVSGESRGEWGGTRVQKFSRQGKKVFLTQSNFRYRAQSDDRMERKAVDDAYFSTITDGFTVVAETDGRVLIDATSFFMKGSQDNIDASRSAFHWPRTRNFPKNTEVEVTVTSSGRDGKTVRRHHSLVELPDSDYRPRAYDQRINLFTTRYMDYATPFTKPIWQKAINRHRLIKKDPAAAISEPIEPIVYYVDPGAPEPIRSALVEGASWWNEAFEEIGFRNAFRVEVLPADADPMDLRYNMILWIHRPTRGWSFGSSVTDPRTGEIICGRVFLGSQRIRQDFLIGSGLKAPYRGDQPDTQEIEEMALARIRQLSAHEVGHTLGFAHNFAASTFGRASVMDYPHPHVQVKSDGTLDLGDAYDVGIGEWDKVSVAYAYTQFPEGASEKEGLEAILLDAQKRDMFWNQTVGPTSANPQTHQWDNGKDAFKEFENVMRVREIALENFSEANIRRGDQMSSLEEVLVPIYLFHRYQTEAISKSLGGLDYRFAARGDGQMTFRFVSGKRQEQALHLLLRTIDTEVLEIPDSILELIPPRGGGGSDEIFSRHTSPMFDPLAAAESATNHTLDFLLNRNRAARLIQQNAQDDSIPSLGKVIDSLLNTTWKKETVESGLRGEIQFAVDDIVLKRLMGMASDSQSTTQVRAIAFAKLVELKNWLEGRAEESERRMAHFLFAQHLIRQFQDDPAKFEMGDAVTPPPGAPIGMGTTPLCGVCHSADGK